MPASPFRRSIPTMLVAIAMVASACAGSSPPPTAARPGAEPDPVGLLPAGSAVPAEPVPTPAIEPSGPAPAPTTVAEPDLLRCLSTRARLAQLLLPLVTQPELGGAQAFAADYELGGIGLLGSPDEGLADQLKALQLASFVPVMVASDEEGGTVQRLADLLGPIPSAAQTAQLKTPDDVRRQWVEYGARVRALGIDVIFGPVLDVGGGPGIESRSFGDDPAVVTAYGQAVADGLLEAGVLPVFKHFPGHGRATADSHVELPVTPPVGDMRSVDLVPFSELVGQIPYRDEAAVMIGHLSVPGLTDGVPASLSPAVINGLLQGELGFRGLVFTDAMNMGAIVNDYGRLEALEAALVAGADIAILGSLADLTPSLNYLQTRVADDVGFAAVVDNRAARVLAAKGQASLCDGAS